MQDKKLIDSMVGKIAARGGSSNVSPTPAGFGARMAAARAAKKAIRTPSVPSRASSNAGPSPVITGKGAKPTVVKQAATMMPDVKQGKKGPAMQTGPGKGHSVSIHIHNK